MTDKFKELLSKSEKISLDTSWDATYEDLPVVFVLDVKDLEYGLEKLEEVKGYGYIATWRKNLFAFNTKLISKRCGLIDENGGLLKAPRVPKI